ncbi:3-oxo-tetronate 4-phosphate decarboxylase [Aestuariivirga sp.]|uniref:3-oxo-tetronate 4-phosphate decarboxylase n=1 Tax=Aestuariivirga sp. TaxID=2650926 RepID=UPI0039E6D93E
MKESAARQLIVDIARSMFERRLTFGSSGNISVKVEDGWLMTPTGSSLGRLDPDALSKIDLEGRHVAGDAPTKESFLHLAMYRERVGAGAVVHLHSTHSVAVSCLDGIDHEDVLPPITAYYVMRVGKLPLIPYYAPGDRTLGEAVGRAAARHSAMLLANHGPVVSGTTLSAATDAIEELEETARLYLLLHGRPTRYLSANQIADLKRRFPSA